MAIILPQSVHRRRISSKAERYQHPPTRSLEKIPSALYFFSPPHGCGNAFSWQQPRDQAPAPKATLLHLDAQLRCHQCVATRSVPHLDHPRKPSEDVTAATHTDTGD